MDHNFETVEVTTDVLILGGGMAATGSAVEAAYWAKKKGLKVTLIDKAAMDRSGAVAMGLSAINQYLGLDKEKNTVEQYVDYVRRDLMGVTREDLVFNIARHVDGSVHLFEKWGLPIWTDADGNYVNEGRWQIMINGESYKIIVSEAAKNALGSDNIMERVFITEPLVVDGKIAGAVGFSTRENKFYVFKAKSVICSMGGAVHVFRPRSTGEGLGRSWYPPFNTGSSAYFTIKSGAEMTCQEVRFIPIRFKDGYGPVGAWFLLFKAKATNAFGENYFVTRGEELKKYAPYGTGKPIPACLRNHLGMLDLFEGKGPIYMRTAEAIQTIAESSGDKKAVKKRLKELENEAWEDFLDMTISQALLWAGQNIQPEEHDSEIAPCEPYFIGSHSGASGAWVSGTKDLSPDEYFWGYEHMTTVPGLFAAGDASGASSHKFSSGSHAEGRVVGKAACKYAVENPDQLDIPQADIDAAMERTLRPLKLWEEKQAVSSDPNINPEFLKPQDYMFRLQKIMDEYAAGVSMQFTTNKWLLERGMELMTMLKEDAEALAAEDHHELMRCWENIHRTWQADAHIQTLYYREETRWPGYYYRADFKEMDEDNWKCFVNCTWKGDKWEMKKVPILNFVK